MDPFADPQGTGLQVVQSLYAFGHGGLTGAGFGQGIQKLHYLPEAHNDFIFAIIGEELGFIGSSLFLLVYLIFIWRGILIAVRCPDMFGMLSGVGIMVMFAIQAFINIGGVTNTIPLTGVTLPFISAGGSSMMVSLISMGVILGISREQSQPQSLPHKRDRKKHIKKDPYRHNVDRVFCYIGSYFTRRLLFCFFFRKCDTFHFHIHFNNS